ncbi:hypothetical protein HPB49_000052 [Dermacentor silvarum]|uniref:Uncharacterized protein n=1 Tax=Dermacentor silvarum TaxID=543639 RepID=A0ACB8CU44_DERSI|nr:hypothetical protein HPB49_000052 [Dermacentor silvarum]
MFSPHLDTRYGSEIQDIIANPPAANLYRHLKAELIHRLSLSQDQKAILQVEWALLLYQLAGIPGRIIVISLLLQFPIVQAVNALPYNCELVRHFEEITRQLSCIQQHLNQSPQSRPHDPQTCDLNVDSSQPDGTGRRYRHFGDRAHKCKTLCSW